MVGVDENNKINSSSFDQMYQYQHIYYQLQLNMDLLTFLYLLNELDNGNNIDEMGVGSV